MQLASVMTPDVQAECPYAALAIAVVARAVHDATGDVSPVHNGSPAQIVSEARAWLADETALVALVELTGHDAAPVVRRVRHLLAETAHCAVPRPATQLQLF